MHFIDPSDLVTAAQVNVVVGALITPDISSVEGHVRQQRRKHYPERGHYFETLTTACQYAERNNEPRRKRYKQENQLQPAGHPQPPFALGHPTFPDTGTRFTGFP